MKKCPGFPGFLRGCSAPLPADGATKNFQGSWPTQRSRGRWSLQGICCGADTTLKPLLMTMSTYKWIHQRDLRTLPWKRGDIYIYTYIYIWNIPQNCIGVQCALVNIEECPNVLLTLIFHLDHSRYLLPIGPPPPKPIQAARQVHPAKKPMRPRPL